MAADNDPQEEPEEENIAEGTTPEEPQEESSADESPQEELGEEDTTEGTTPEEQPEEESSSDESPLVESAEEAQHEKSVYEYIDEIKVLIRRKTYGSALRIVKDAMAHYPEDPYVLSYCGLLTALVQKKHKDGIKMCKSSLKSLKKSDYDKTSAYPSLYLNFGRVYLLSGDRNKAFDTFHKGLSKDHEYKDLIWELKKLGIRRPPVIPFLGRSFFLNKYLGKLRHWIMTR